MSDPKTDRILRAERHHGALLPGDALLACID